MRKPILLALLGCGATLMGHWSLPLAGQTQAPGQQAPARQRPEPGQPSQPNGQSAQGSGRASTGHPTDHPKQPAGSPAIPSGYRLLTLKEGRAIAEGIAWVDDEEGLAPDCSHLVHKLYEQAGYPYPYASSVDLYRGSKPFLRVRYAHPGDLVVWPGHVGIVESPWGHTFFSTTSSGTRIEDYRSAYWRARGYPHFFRYLTKSPANAGGGTTAAAGRAPQY